MKKNKMKMNISEESIEIKNFITVLLIVVLSIVAIYVFTRTFITKDLFVNKDNTTEKEETETAVLDYSTTTLGLLFNRPYKSYYVFAYDYEDAATMLYNTLINVYSKKEKSLKIYYADLSDTFNKTFVAENSTPTAKSAADLKVKGPTLIKIENGKITKFLETKEAITKELDIK